MRLLERDRIRMNHAPGTGANMNRRIFLAILGAVVTRASTVRAQQGTSIPTIGVLWHSGSANEEQPYFDALLQGFRELGYVEGRTIRFEHRFPNEMPDRYRQMAAELVALKVDVIVTVGNAPITYARDATSTIPIVFLFVADPIGAHLVDSLAHPGGNITGQAQLGADLTAKRLELLRDVVPKKLSRAALLFNPEEPSGERYLKEARSAADTLGLTVLPFELGAASEMERVFERMAEAGVQALSLGPGGLLFQIRAGLQKLAIAHGIPTCGWSRETSASGLLLSYGPDQREMARHQAVFVDKILRGTRPADLPVEQPTRFELVVNQRTAKALGIEIPASLLLRADELIE
jgi:putative tryptophan/tyrosine transport system substrate-binding protein